MEMKKVWVVTAGCYSDYHVVGLYSTKKNAELIHKKLSEVEFSDMNEIEEWKIDDGIKEARKGYAEFNIIMLRDGTVERVYKQDLSVYPAYTNRYSIWERTKAPAYKGKGVPDALNAHVWGRNEKHAIKIANETRTRMIASGEWK
jgi:hypothetical protein